MSRYIRTKDGEIFDTEVNGAWETTDGTVGIPTINGIVVTPKEFITKRADTIERLCDCFVYQKKIYRLEKRVDGSRYLDRYCLGGYDHHDIVDLDKSLVECLNEFIPEHRKNTYGAIWTAGKQGEPILKSVAMVNEKGEFELL